MLSATFPQVITHEKMLVNCEAEFDEFVSRMSLLNEKLGPLLFQFPHFDQYQFNGPEEFLRRLRFFLKRAKEMFTTKFGAGWVTARESRR
jgi:uncharacterized protein YecE (DUF72 family)